MELLNVNIPNWSDMGNWIPEAVLCVGFLAYHVDRIMDGKAVTPIAFHFFGGDDA